jgi:hypothetical protein
MELHDPQRGTQAAAAQPPTEEFAAVIAAKVECHLRAGHFAIAVRVIEQAEREWAEELQEQTRQLARSPEQWLDRPLLDFGLQVRIVNTLERFGVGTMREALAYLNEHDIIPQIGPHAREEVWQAARERRITIERKLPLVPGGAKPRETTMRDRKWNWGRDALGSPENT